MDISIIITTYNRLESLLITLKSLQNQTFSNFEIIVVDNAADLTIYTQIKDFNKTAKIKINYIAHSSGGNAGARNRGVQEASGELLVFTDDDLTFDPDWLTSYQKVFIEHPEMLASGGCVKPHWEVSPPDWLTNYIGDSKVFSIYALMDLSQYFMISNQGFFFGCNMAIRKSVFETKGFHPELFGTKTLGDGESGLNQELINENHLIGYVPGAIAYHHISKERMTVSYIKRWAWHLGGATMYQKWWNRKRTVFSISKEFIIILARYLIFWLIEFFVYHQKDKKAIDIQFKASLGRSKLTYLWWMLSDKKLQQLLDNPNPYIL